MGSGMVRGALAALMELCYPARCAGCDAAVRGAGFVCEDCDAALVQLQRRAECGLCGMPLGGAGGPCPYCLGKGMAHYDRIVRLGNFSEPLKGLIHRAKYGGRWPVAEQLAARLLDKPEVRPVIAAADCIVPVPLHPLRQIRRGYNQAGVIAAELGRRCGVGVAAAAVRVRHTQTQTDLRSRRDRERNVRDAFALEDSQAIAGRRVVVVDDVMTSGATLRSLGRVLRRGRPAELSAAVLAVADPRGRDFQLI